MNLVSRYLRSLRSRGNQARALQLATHVVVSLPKNGDTWMRAVLGKALCLHYGLPETKLFDLAWLTRNAGIGSAFFTHDGSDLPTDRRKRTRIANDEPTYTGKHVLMLRRDPRDAVLSWYFYATRTVPLFSGTLSEFLRDARYGIDEACRWYTKCAASFDSADSFALIEYEDRRSNPEAETIRALEFLGGFDITDDTVCEAVEFAASDSFRRAFAGGCYELASHERLRDSQSLDDGPVGGFRDYFNADDLDYCRDAVVQAACPFLDARAHDLTRVARRDERGDAGNTGAPARSAG